MEEGELSALQAEQARLAQQLAWLKQQVRRPRVGLSADREGALLGQTLLLTGTVTDPFDGEGLVDQPVTLTTTTGILRLGEGYQFRQGQVVGARTDAFGQVQVSLLPPSVEALEARHLHALQAQLARIAPLPESTEQLNAVAEQLARAYDWESAVDFREATDRLFGEAQASQLSSEVAGTSAWPTQELAVTLHVHDHQGIAGASLLHLALGHWLAPLMRALQSLRGQAGDLLGQLGHQTRVRRRVDLLDSCQSQVDRFVEASRGRLGQLAARRHAQEILDQFIREGLGGLNPELRRNLDRGLRAAGAVLGGRVAATSAGLSGLRQEMRGELGQQLKSLDITSVKGLGDSLGQLGRQVDQVAATAAKKLDPEALVILRHALDANLQELSKRVPNFKEQLPELLAPKADSPFVPLRELNLNLGNRIIEIRKPIVTPETPSRPIVVNPVVLGPVIKPKTGGN